MRKLIFSILLIITLLITSTAGCCRQSLLPASPEGLSPFNTTRVATVHIVMEEEDWVDTQQYALAEQYVPADFWFDGELVPDVAIRPKGNSSLQQTFRSQSPRYSFKVDFNLFNRARNFRGLKKVNLNNGWSDPTLIRERLGYELFAQMGVPAPHSSFVDLWINDTHLGIYTMVEQVDRTFLSRHFSDADGNLYKPEMPAASLDWTKAKLEEERARVAATTRADSSTNLDVNLGGGNLRDIMQALEQEPLVDGVPATIPTRIPPLGGSQRLQGDYLKLMGLKTNENSSDHSALLHFLEILNSEPEETFPTEIEKVLDVDGVLRFLAVSTLIVHLDNYIALGHNYYLYNDNGKFVILPWDLNMAFGTFNYGLDRNGLINYYIDEPTGGPMAERPLVERLLSYQPYLNTYHDYLRKLINGPFSADKINSRIDELAALIRPFIKADELKFYSTADFERGLSEDVIATSIPGGRTPIGLKAFVAERIISVRQQLNGLRQSSLGDGSGNRGSFRRPDVNRRPGDVPPVR